MLLLLLAACGRAEPIPAEPLLIRATTGAVDVPSGAAFPLTVVRVWQKDLDEPKWSDDILAPLVVRPVSTERREDALRIEETRRFRAYAFGSGEIRTAPLRIEATPRGGTTPHVATAEPVVVRVTSALVPGAAGPVELPPGPLRERSPWGAVALGAAVFVAATYRYVTSRRRRHTAAAFVRNTAPAAPAPPPVPPHVVAAERLRAIRERAPGDSAAIAADFVEASSIVRDFIAARFAIHSHEQTSEELLAAARRAPEIPAQRLRLLSGFLAACDSVKFAQDAPGAAERTRLLDAADAFIAETSAGAEPAR